MNNSYSTGQPSHTVQNKVVASLAAMASFAIVGSGGYGFNYDYFSKNTQHTDTPNFIAKSMPEISQVEHQLDFIKTTFDLKNQELAEIFKVERKTVHNWKAAGEIPRDASRQRVFEIFMVAKSWKAEGFEIDRILLKRNILNELSIYSLLVSDTVDIRKILFFANSLSAIIETEQAIELF